MCWNVCVHAVRRDRDIDCEKKAHMRRLLDAQIAEKAALEAAERAADVEARRCSCMSHANSSP